MKYIVSDIHGEYDLFIKLLKKINFSKNDNMIICGDIIEKGKESIKLLKYVKNKPNIIFIIGNHENDFLRYYKSIIKNHKSNLSEDELLIKINSYLPVEESKLDWDDLLWLERCPYFFEDDNYICVHAGICLNKNNEIINPADNDIKVLVYDRSFKEPNLVVNNSKCVFYGHTPTSYLINKHRIIAYKRKGVDIVRSVKDYYKVHLDCGTYFSGVLGCFCIDNCKAYYVEK